LKITRNCPDWAVPAGWRLQNEQLPAFHKLSVRLVVRLHVEQGLPFAQDIEDRDDAGGFFILGEEVRRAWRKPVGVVLRNEPERVGGDVVAPDAGQVGLVAGVFLDEDLAAVGDRHVIHHLRAFRAVQEHVDDAAGGWIARIMEVQAPEAAVAAEAGGGDEVEVARQDEVPRAVLGPLELCDAGGAAHGLQVSAANVRHVAEAVEGEGSAVRNPGRRVFERIALDLNAEEPTAG
jgi:hypothetical protein